MGGKRNMSKSERPVRVLLVDDCLERVEMMGDAIREHGYRCETASSTPIALRMLVTERFDALVTDVRMPVVHGIRLLRESSKVHPTRPMIVVMTAFQSVDAAVETNEGGLCHYLAKPFRMDVLARLLDEQARPG